MSSFSNFATHNLPDVDHPHRSITADVKTGRAHGLYQCVVTLPEHPSRADIYRAFSVAASSLAELAHKWQYEEDRSGILSDTNSQVSYRVTVDLRMLPERQGDTNGQ